MKSSMTCKVVINARLPLVAIVERQWFSGKIQLCHTFGD